MSDVISKRPTGTTLTIELPAIDAVPEALRDPEFVVYALAGTLYSQGEVSGKEARSLTGDSRRVFEEKMAHFGFPLLSDDAETIATELDVGF